MWALVINLPLMIPPNNEKWDTFLLSAQAGYLSALVLDHKMFTRCYPGANIAPKMHYMVHFAQQY